MNNKIAGWSILTVVALFLLLYIIPLGARPIIIPDESRYAEIAREMLVTGDWIVPRLNGLRYFEKPVLGYWLIAAAIRLFGESAFAIRLPSALASGISALIIFLLLGRSGRGYRDGLISAAVYLTCFEVFVLGTTNILDSAFAMFITITMASLFLAYQANNSGSKRRWQAVGGIFAGLAFLTKGFVAFAVPAIAFIPFLLWQERGRKPIGDLWVPLAAAGLVVLPWSAAIYFREGDFWRYFFWTEHVNRFLGSDPQHPESFWYYLPMMAWGALPWVFLLPAALGGLARTRIRDPLLRFAACWFLLPFLLFSASRGKLCTYILPCYPPLAILLTLGILEYFAAGRKKMFNVGALVLMGVLIILAVGLAVVHTVDFPARRIFNRSETWKWIIAVDGILIWSFFLFLAARRKQYLQKLIFFCVAPVVFLFGSHFIFPHAFEEGVAPQNFLRDHAFQIKPDTTLVSDSYCTSALCWFYGRNDIKLIEPEGEFGYGLNYPDAQGSRLSFKQFIKMAGDNPRGKETLLILDTDRYLEYRRKFPKFAFIKSSDGFVMAGF